MAHGVPEHCGDRTRAPQALEYEDHDPIDGRGRIDGGDADGHLVALDELRRVRGECAVSVGGHAGCLIDERRAREDGCTVTKDVNRLRTCRACCSRLRVDGFQLTCEWYQFDELQPRGCVSGKPQLDSELANIFYFYDKAPCHTLITVVVCVKRGRPAGIQLIRDCLCVCQDALGVRCCPTSDNADALANRAYLNSLVMHDVRWGGRGAAEE